MPEQPFIKKIILCASIPLIACLAPESSLYRIFRGGLETLAQQIVASPYREGSIDSSFRSVTSTLVFRNIFADYRRRLNYPQQTIPFKLLMSRTGFVAGFLLSRSQWFQPLSKSPPQLIRHDPKPKITVSLAFLSSFVYVLSFYSFFKSDVRQYRYFVMRGKVGITVVTS